jgi:hypothetical protein
MPWLVLKCFWPICLACVDGPSSYLLNELCREQSQEAKDCSRQGQIPTLSHLCLHSSCWGTMPMPISSQLAASSCFPSFTQSTLPTNVMHRSALLKMAPADTQLSTVKALAAQAGAGAADRQALIASGAVPKLLKYLSSKTAAIVSQSALALSRLGSDASARSSLWEHRRALVPALVATLKSGGPLTLARSLAALAALIQHVPEAGAAVIKAGGIVPLLRIAQTASEELRDAAAITLNAFHVRQMDPGMADPVEVQTCRAIYNQGIELLEPLIRALFTGPMQAKLFAMRVLRMIPEEPRVIEALRRPSLTDLLVGFASADDPAIASGALGVLAMALGNHPPPGKTPPEAAVYMASPQLCKVWESLHSRLHSPHPAVVEASLRYLNEVCTPPRLHVEPWVRECMRDIPRLLASESHVIKGMAVSLAARDWLGRYAVLLLK